MQISIYAVQRSGTHAWNQDCDYEYPASAWMLLKEAAIAEMEVITTEIVDGEGYTIDEIDPIEGTVTLNGSIDGEPVIVSLRVVEATLEADVEDFAKACVRQIAKQEAETLEAAEIEPIIA